jgi:hypothetical protein
MFVRVTGEGLLYPFRVKDQDLEWSNTSNADVVLTGSEVLLVELTIDHEVTAENGSFLFKASVNNGSNNRDDFVNIIFREGDDNAIASKSIQIDKGDTNVAITLYGSFTKDWPSGTTFRIYGTSGQDSIVKGTIMPTGLKVVEAQAAPVTEYIQTNNDFGNDISRQEIENVLNSANIAILSNFKTYLIADINDVVWKCTYLKKLDKFAVKKLTLK